MIEYGTASLARASERLDFWRHLVGQAFVPMDALPQAAPEDAGPFHGRIQVDGLAQLQVALVDAGSHLVSRTPRLIADVDREFYQVNLQVSGRCAVVKNDRVDLLAPGDMTLLDSSEVYKLVFDGDHKMLCFALPHKLLPLDPDRVARLTATRLSGRQGVGALMVPFLTTLARQVFAQDVRSQGRLAGNVVDLTETLLIERMGELADTQSEAPGRLLRLRVCDDIQGRLGSPDLTPAKLAERHHISVRYLHHLFEAEGTTVSQWIRERRLERCRRDLADPAMSRIPAAAIGARWGLRDPAHFSRAFKTQFGLTPGECRRLPQPTRHLAPVTS